jgi:predicted CopG family antitoxin
MYLLTIVFGPSPTPWSLLFEKPEAAEDVFFSLQKSKQEKRDFIDIVDEFGQRTVIDIASIHGFMLEDMEKSKLAHIERGLHQARTQAKAQQAATQDPVLKSAAMMRGPAMIDPMGNSRFS